MRISYVVPKRRPKILPYCCSWGSFRNYSKDKGKIDFDFSPDSCPSLVCVSPPPSHFIAVIIILLSRYLPYQVGVPTISNADAFPYFLLASADKARLA